MVLTSFIKKISFLQELTIIAIVLIIAFNYLEPEKIIIKADGKGYYEYLPAIFIYNDLSWEYLDTLDTPGYYKHSEYKVGAIVGPENDLHNKYFIGTALLMAPFFGVAHLTAHFGGYAPDGYSLPYQTLMWISSLFYLLIGLWYIRKVLTILKIRRFIVFLVQIFMVFATPLLHYVTFEPTFSHVYSFATISALFYYGMMFYTHKKNMYLYVFSSLTALTFLVRPNNVIIIPAILIVANNFNSLKCFVKHLVKKKKLAILIGVIIFSLIVCFQCIVWYLQKGTFILDSYGNESFNFSNPQLFNYLFSYKKGLFVYSPVLFFGLLLGTIYFVVRKYIFKSVIILTPLFVFIYISSSWWSWWYGMGYGQRPIVDILMVFAIIFAYGLNYLPKRFLLLILPIILLSIPVTVIQNYQYKNYMLHWDNMDKTSFWEVFLKTHDKYRGLFWQSEKQYFENQVLYTIDQNISIKASPSNTVSIVDIHMFNSIFKEANDIIELECDINDYKSNSKIILSLKDKNDSIIYWGQHFTYHKTRQNGIATRAKFQFLLDSSQKNAEKLFLGVKTSENEVVLNNCVVKFISFNASPNTRNKQKHNDVYNSLQLKTYDRAYEEAEKIRIKLEMLSDINWMNSIVEKAKQRNISIEEMMEIDAEYMLDKY